MGNLDWYINNHRKVLIERENKKEENKKREMKKNEKERDCYIIKCFNIIIDDLAQKIKLMETPIDGYYYGYINLKNEFVYTDNIINSFIVKLQKHYKNISNIKFKVSFKKFPANKLNKAAIQLKYELTILI